MGPERAEEEKDQGKLEQTGVQSRKRRTTGQEQREKDREKMEKGGLEPRKRKRTQEEEKDEQKDGGPKWRRRSEAEIERDKELVRRYEDPATRAPMGGSEVRNMEKLRRKNERLERSRKGGRDLADELQMMAYGQVSTASPLTGQTHQ